MGIDGLGVRARHANDPEPEFAKRRSHRWHIITIEDGRLVCDCEGFQKSVPAPTKRCKHLTGWVGNGLRPPRTRNRARVLLASSEQGVAAWLNREAQRPELVAAQRAFLDACKGDPLRIEAATAERHGILAATIAPTAPTGPIKQPR
jgi:hypothetical protein